MQWHPIFAYLLRPVVQDYYDIQGDVPVGDLPRQADIVLLRRRAPAPFVGIWSHLTALNILEFKGPTVDPRSWDLDLLIELGLGIERKLRDNPEQQGSSPLGRGDVSWWYLANHVGKRFLAEAQSWMGNVLQPVAEGLWRGPMLGRMLIVVSRDQLAVDRESVPLHLVTDESAERALRLAHEVARQPGYWQNYGSWLAFLHPKLWEEAEHMIQTLGTGETLDLRPFIEKFGLQKFIDQVGLEKVIDQVGVEKVIETVGREKVLEALGPEQTIDDLLAKLTPEQVQKLKRRLP